MLEWLIAGPFSALGAGTAVTLGAIGLGAIYAAVTSGTKDK